MRITRTFLVIAGLCVGLFLGASDEVAITPNDLIMHADDYSGKSVVVHGTVSDIERTVMVPKSTELTFQLCASACVTVLTWGAPTISDGEAVTVRGNFLVAKVIGVTRVDNVIVASEIQLPAKGR